MLYSPFPYQGSSAVNGQRYSPHFTEKKQKRLQNLRNFASHRIAFAQSQKNIEHVRKAALRDEFASVAINQRFDDISAISAIAARVVAPPANREKNST